MPTANPTASVHVVKAQPLTIEDVCLDTSDPPPESEKEKETRRGGVTCPVAKPFSLGRLGTAAT